MYVNAAKITSNKVSISIVSIDITPSSLSEGVHGSILWFLNLIIHPYISILLNCIQGTFYVKCNVYKCF